MKGCVDKIMARRKLKANGIINIIKLEIAQISAHYLLIYK